MLDIKLFQRDTEDDIVGRVLHGAGTEVEFISQVQVEEDTSTSGVGVMVRSTWAAVGDKPSLSDQFSILIQVYVDRFPRIIGGIEREVHPPGSTEAGHKLASVDINTRRISLQTRLAGVKNFVVRDNRAFGRKSGIVIAEISKWGIPDIFYLFLQLLVFSLDIFCCCSMISMSFSVRASSRLLTLLMRRLNSSLISSVWVSLAVESLTTVRQQMMMISGLLIFKWER